MVGVDAAAHRRCRGDAAQLTRLGLYNDKLDGKAGMQTRAALGAYQKSAGLKVDCWPSEAVLRSIERGALGSKGGRVREAEEPRLVGSQEVR